MKDEEVLRGLYAIQQLIMLNNVVTMHVAYMEWDSEWRKQVGVHGCLYSYVYSTARTECSRLGKWMNKQTTTVSSCVGFAEPDVVT